MHGPDWSWLRTVPFRVGVLCFLYCWSGGVRGSGAIRFEEMETTAKWRFTERVSRDKVDLYQTTISMALALTSLTANAISRMGISAT